ncbi:MAG: hypothetical protein GX811_07480 [Lentisphaerae bacterium]|nr:hypothetical protein [Lentisphaerota bacterium]
MQSEKSTFALFFGNRGFFPASLQADARKQIESTLKKLGHKTISLDPKATRYGAVQTPAEGEIYANFLEANRGKFDGIILSLPNFGDENGAIVALRDANVPILIQAFPDELDKMAPADRRDAFCGKFSIMDVFCQSDIPFTALQPHTVHPHSPRFADNIDHFDRICRVVKGMRRMTVGAIGARTTEFKTVRIDEVALQHHDITMETLDLSEVFHRMDALKMTSPAYKAKEKVLKAYTDWKGVPASAFRKLTKLGVIVDELIEEYKMDALALRCWVEMQRYLGISPCIILSELNNRGIAAACEVDVGNAISMYALRLASGTPATCLDWNNNYEDEDDKCILFHCGPVPQSMMTTKGHIEEHAILANTVGKGCSFGCNIGRITPTPFTYSSMLTEEGELRFYLGEGNFTDDPIPTEFFGCAGVAEIEDLQSALQTIGYAGFRHHVSVTAGHYAAPVAEAFTDYLGYDLIIV